MSFKQTLITAALPYTNGPVHIGHLAGVYIPADIYARYLRLKGKKVLFVYKCPEIFFLFQVFFSATPFLRGLFKCFLKEA